MRSLVEEVLSPSKPVQVLGLGLRVQSGMASRTRRRSVSTLQRQARVRAIALIFMALAGCGADINVADMAASDIGVAGPDLAVCWYGDVSGSACTQPNAVMQGNCFESPRCVCVSPEATWVCCYAGYGGRDAPGLRSGDPCCGPNSTVPNAPGYPCYCDDTHHWACPFDLGTND
jgi:hypothetical protein